MLLYIKGRVRDRIIIDIYYNLSLIIL